MPPTSTRGKTVARGRSNRWAGWRPGCQPVSFLVRTAASGAMVEYGTTVSLHHQGVIVSNHYSAANLRFPGDDARLDFTDLYAFSEPHDAGKTILIMDANPYTGGMSAMPPFLMKSEFHPDGVYRINIDNNGDARADAAFTFVFSEFRHGMQTGTVYYATGSDAQQPEPAGDVLISGTPVGFDATAQPVQAAPCRLFIGVR